MNIWVTGCAGFLGRRLSPKLIALGHRVVGISRRRNPILDISAQIDLSSTATCSQLKKLARDSGNPDVVVHAAAQKPGAFDSSEYVRLNVLATANLLAALDSFPPRQLVFTSTLSVYGQPDSNPVKETHPAGTHFIYAMTKRWAEQLLEEFRQPTQMTILRLPSLYGAGQEDSFIDGIAGLAIRNEQIELFAQGETVRDALHVDDVVGAIVSSITLPPESRYCSMNLGCGQRVTTAQYVSEVVQAFGSSSKIVPVDRPSNQQFDLYADIGKAQGQIGFIPSSVKASMVRYANELQTQS